MSHRSTNSRVPRGIWKSLGLYFIIAAVSTLPIAAGTYAYDAALGNEMAKNAYIVMVIGMVVEGITLMQSLTRKNSARRQVMQRSLDLNQENSVVYSLQSR